MKDDMTVTNGPVRKSLNSPSKEMARKQKAPSQVIYFLAPQVGLERKTLRLTAESSSSFKHPLHPTHHFGQ
jgi:hypothetical protein